MTLVWVFSCVCGGGWGGAFYNQVFLEKSKKRCIQQTIRARSYPHPQHYPTLSSHNPNRKSAPPSLHLPNPPRVAASFFGFKCHGWGTIPNSTVFNRHKIENGFLHADLIRTRFHWWQLMELLFISTNTRPKKLTFLEKRRRFPLRVDCLLRKLAE